MRVDDYNAMVRAGRIEDAGVAQSEQETTLLSIAISLKRIADAIEQAARDEYSDRPVP